MVTHQLQVERRTGKVRRPETDVLPLCHATNSQWGPIYKEKREEVVGLFLRGRKGAKGGEREDAKRKGIPFQSQGEYRINTATKLTVRMISAE